MTRPLRLSRGQRGALQTLCETFAPPIDGEGGGAADDPRRIVVRTLEHELGLLPRPLDRIMARFVLWLLGGRIATVLSHGGFRRLGQLPLADRERVLRAWADSQLPQRRAVFHGMRKLALTATYTAAPVRGRSPRWELIGYPGPPGRVGDPKRPLRPMSIGRNPQLDCDVVVVGSGAGGGPAAAVLAGAGLEVIVVERGGHFDEADFDGSELAANRRMYRGFTTRDRSVGLAEGSCLGGGTVVNYTSSFRTPGAVREEWAAMGAKAFADPEYDRALDAVCDRLGVNSEHSRPSPRDRLLRDGLAALGWRSSPVPRNVQGCEQGLRCGFCGYGCPDGAKRSTLNTWLPDAARAGARIFVDTSVERITFARGTATGVIATHGPSRSPVPIRSRAVVCAAGAVHSPALLTRSGLGNGAVGRHLHLHPSTTVLGEFDRDVSPWGGTLQAVYSDQHQDLDGKGHGVRYATMPVHPGMLASLGPWRSARQHLDMMRALPRTCAVVVQVRDRDAGAVRTGRGGRPVVDYRPSPYDIAHVRVGIANAARILREAGAERIFTAHTRLCDSRGDLADLTRQTDAAGYGPGQCAYSSVHLMGSARMGANPTQAVCDPDGRVYGARNLVMCDASTFPTASGVNPMITVQASAWLSARVLASDLG